MDGMSLDLPVRRKSLIDTLLAIKQLLQLLIEFLGREVRAGHMNARRVLRVLAAESDKP